MWCNGDWYTFVCCSGRLLDPFSRGWYVGLDWDIETAPIITAEGGNAFDPTAVPLGDGSYRVYYSATEGNDTFSESFIKSGILKRDASL